MASRTICAELTIVFVLLFMAGVAIRWRVFEYTILMALRARHAGVFPLKFEGELGMVNADPIPRRRRMA